jgi:hypothetical protein
MPSENSPEMRRREENARKNKNSRRPMTGSKGQMNRDLKTLVPQGYTGEWNAKDESDKARQVRKAAQVKTGSPNFNVELNKRYMVEDKRTGPKYQAALDAKKNAKKNALKASLSKAYAKDAAELRKWRKENAKNPSLDAAGSAKSAQSRLAETQETMRMLNRKAK